MPEQDFLDPVEQVIREVFPEAASLRDLQMGSVPGWDSMGHMSLVAALENRFQVNFPTYRLAELTNAAAIAAAISEQKA